MRSPFHAAGSTALEVEALVFRVKYAHKKESTVPSSGLESIASANDSSRTCEELSPT